MSLWCEVLQLTSILTVTRCVTRCDKCTGHFSIFWSWTTIYGTTIYIRIFLKEGYPYAHNTNETELTIFKTENHSNLTMVGLYRSLDVAMPWLFFALRTVLDKHSSSHNIFIGTLNINGMMESDRQSVYNLMLGKNKYRPLRQITEP